MIVMWHATESSQKVKVLWQLGFLQECASAVAISHTGNNQGNRGPEHLTKATDGSGEQEQRKEGIRQERARAAGKRGP